MKKNHVINWIKQWEQEGLNKTQIENTISMIKENKFVECNLDILFVTKNNVTTFYHSEQTEKNLGKLGKKLYNNKKLFDFLKFRKSNKITKILELYFLTQGCVAPYKFKMKKEYLLKKAFSNIEIKLLTKKKFLVNKDLKKISLIDYIGFLRLLTRFKWEKEYKKKNLTSEGGIRILYNNKKKEVIIKEIELNSPFIGNFEQPTETELIGRPINSKNQEFILGKVVLLGEFSKKDVNGKIIIVPNCRPELVEYFAKSIIAFASEEGGVTSHAAIVAMQMGIPCIIGVKGIMTALKDEDCINMNMKTGEIIKETI